MGLSEPPHPLASGILGERRNYKFKAVTSLAAAKAAILRTKTPFQVVIADSTNDEVVGSWPPTELFRFVRLLKTKNPKCVFVLLIDSEMERSWLTVGRKGVSFVLKPFNWQNLHVLIGHASEVDELQRITHQQEILKQLMATGSLLGEQDQRVILDRILGGIVSTGYDRARLYLLSEDNSRLIGKAQMGMEPGQFVPEWSVNDYPFFRELLKTPRPQVFNVEQSEGPYRLWLEKQGVIEWGSLPLILRDRVIGKISVDNQRTQNPIFESDLELISLFATQAAAAIENANLIENVKRQQKNQEYVLQLTNTINSSLDLEKTLNATCKAAVELLKVDHSGLVLFDDEYRWGEVVAEYPQLGSVGGEKIPVKDEPAEEELIETGEPLVVSDLKEDKSLGRVGEMLRRHGVRSTMILPVKKANKVLGSFSLETINNLRRFNEEDIQLAENFAQQVALAIDNARLYNNSVARTKQLELLREGMLDITRCEHQALLTTVVQKAVTLLSANSGGMYRRNAKRGTLTIVADSQRPHNVGKRIKDGEGMAGGLVSTGKLFDMTDDYRAWPERAKIFEEDKPFGSVLEVPLRLGDEVKGVLYVDSEVGRRFSKEEAELLLMFADSAATIFDRAEHRQYLARLVASSPNGIIAADTDGNIIEFNTRAEELTHFKKEDRLGRPVSEIYADEDEDRRIGALLNSSRDGSVESETALERIDSERIPVRLSATWLEGIDGKRTGSVGYFEDLRYTDQMEGYVKLLTNACTLTVASDSGSPGLEPDALQTLSDLLVSLVCFRYCRVLLFDEKRTRLIVKTESFALREGESITTTDVGKSFSEADLPELHYLATRDTETVLSASIEDQRTILNRLSGWMRTQLKGQSLNSVAIIPLKVAGSVIGVFELGEVRSETRNPISEEKLELVKAIVSLSSAIIERLEREAELESQSLAIHEISNAFELDDVMRTIVVQAAKLFSADSCSLWPFDEEQLRFIPEDMVAHGIDDELLSRLRSEEGAPGKSADTILETGHLEVPNIADSDLGGRTKELCHVAGIKSVRGVLLKAGDDPVGVLFLYYQRSNESTRRSRLLDVLTLVSGLALKRAKLFDQLTRGISAAEGLAEEVVIGDREKILGRVTDEVLENVGCDLVILYEYDEENGVLVHSPTVKPEGLKNSIPITATGQVSKLLHQVLETKKPLWINNTEEHPLFAVSRFTQEQQIKSCAVIPLIYADHRVGIMFVNYRAPHRFVHEKKTLSYLASQAAVTFRNLQLWQQTKRKEAHLITLFESSKQINGRFDRSRGEILGQIVDQAFASVAGGKLVPPSFAVIQSYDPEKKTLTFESTFPPDAIERLAARVGYSRSIDPKFAPQGKKGLTGLAIETGKTQLVNKGMSNPDRLIVDPQMTSELVVPLIDRKDKIVLGVLGVQSNSANFGADDTYILEALGELSVMAIKTVNLLEALQRAKDDLEEVVNKKTEFFENVSHDLMTPITSIKELLGLALDGDYGEVGSLLRSRLSQALSVARKEERLIRNLLEIRQLDRDKPEPNFARVDLVTVVRDIVSEFEYQFEKQEVKLRVIVASESQLAEVNVEAMKAVVSNLIENALKFTQQGGKVTVSLIADKSNIELRIHDTGCGIHPKYHDRIFERGFQIDSKEKSQGGSGLGLDIVRRNVSLHKGTVRVHSKPLIGSEFVVKLPTTQSDELYD